MTAVELNVSLDFALPADVAVGAGTALFVGGTCFSPGPPTRDLHLVVGGQQQSLIAHGMPRLDYFAGHHPQLDPYATEELRADPLSAEDPSLRAYRSGFWGLATIPARLADGEVELLLRAQLSGGGEAGAPLGAVRTRPLPAPPVPPAADPPPVAICMATHNPPLDLLRRQVDSIRAQTYRDWVCYVSDDCSNDAAFAGLRSVVDSDPRFVVSRSPRRLGFFMNFERALTMVPPQTRFVALSDQDDHWHDGKLETLLAHIGGAQLVYSDARIVARDGALISETYWPRRRNNHESMLSLLVANAVTGAASLFRRDLLDVALPFPPAQFSHYHDHWIALTALALGEIRFIDRALYDYVQHGETSLGHAAANQMPTLGDRLGSLRRRIPRERIRKWRMHYFVDFARLVQFATILEMRCGERMAPGKRRALERFAHGDESASEVLLLAGRGVRELFGRPETLGAEWMLFGALLWRRLLAASATERPRRRLRLDAVPPPSLALAPERGAGLVGTAARAISDKIAPLELEVRDDAPPRVNLLIPTIDLDHLFGGYIAKFSLAGRLADRGARVRVVTVDPAAPLPRTWKRKLESYGGLAGLTDRVEWAFGRESGRIEVSRSDRFIATTWWTAHIAHEARELLGGEPVLYLIQEYEPFTFPMGAYAALARQSYAFPHRALFSTELLRDYFRRERIGVYANGAAAGDAASATFQNAITRVDPPSAAELARRDSRRLLFYARPEAHAARNMFELGVLALSRALADGAFRRGWELRGIGTVESGGRLSLGGDAALELLPRADQDAYARVLRDHDLGLALMYTPHPSLVPIEMASAGMLTVTNCFANKTPAAMAAISSNLITAEPSIEGIAAALHEAAARIDDFEGRAAGSRVHWSRDWRSSFHDELLRWIEASLGL